MLEMVGSRRSSLENKEIEGFHSKIDESPLCVSKETTEIWTHHALPSTTVRLIKFLQMQNPGNPEWAKMQIKSSKSIINWIKVTSWGRKKNACKIPSWCGRRLRHNQKHHRDQGLEKHMPWLGTASSLACLFPSPWLFLPASRLVSLLNNKRWCFLPVVSYGTEIFAAETQHLMTNQKVL